MQNSLRSSSRTFCHLILLVTLLLLAPIDHGGLGAPVAVEEAGDDLGENFPDEPLHHILLRLYAPLDYLLEVATLAKLHDNVNF